jgi:hypothetical protein
MKKKIFAILLLTILVVNFYTPTSAEADVLPRITNSLLQNFGI